MIDYRDKLRRVLTMAFDAVEGALDECDRGAAESIDVTGMMIEEARNQLATASDLCIKIQDLEGEQL